MLHSLSTADDPSLFEDVTDWLSELFAEFQGFEFDPTPLREVMVVAVERGGQRVSARSLPDGTLRLLGEVLAVLTVPDLAVFG